MRRAALLAAFALFAPAAHAEPFIYPPEELPVDPDSLIMCGMCPDDMIAPWVDRVADSIAVGPTPDPDAEAASTRTFAVAAYGESTTSCTITLDKGARSFRGATSCSRSLAQTAQASTSGGASVTGALCSGTRSSCSSSGTTTSAYTTLSYHVTLQAPAGQGWVAPPTECSGAGTDRLDCTFAA